MPRSDVFDAPDGSDRKALLDHTLRRRILTMELAPGAVLDEIALSEEFGLSRPPVRETMRQLAGEGFIELEQNRAARVTSMSYQTLRDFFLAAPMIYTATTRLAALNRTAREIDELKQIQNRFRDAVRDGDVEARVFLNNKFHLFIGEMAHNVYLIPSLRRLLIDHARIGRTFYQEHPEPRQQANLETAVEQHDAIIAAIEKRDVTAAEDLIRAHWELSRRNMAMYATPEGLDVPLGA